MRKFTLTKELFEKVKSALERRKNGEDVDIDQFVEIFE